MIEIRLPNITGRTDAEQLAQVKSYLYQFVEQLNYALSEISSASPAKEVYIPKSASQIAAEKEEKSLDEFNSMKSLIIKSADIVEAYSTEIGKNLEGVYVAQSDFGTYVKETGVEVLLNDERMKQNFINTEVIKDVDGLTEFYTQTKAHVKTGKLYEDDVKGPVYGLEIGQRTEIGDEEVFNQYARFTADRLSFYDNNGREVAYISDDKLYVSNAEVTTSLICGGYIDTRMEDGSVVTTWVWEEGEDIEQVDD